MNEQTDQIKKLESELKMLREKLSISQSLVKVGFWELDRKTKQIFLSDESLAMINLKSDNDWKNIDSILEVICAESKEHFKSEIYKLIEGKEDLDIEFDIEIPSRQEKLTLRAKAAKSENKTKNPDILVGIFQNITEQKQTELSLKNAKIKAEEADILKSAFLANMSHEIRTPLNAILGFSRLLTNPEIPDVQKQEYSEYITNSANNLLNLIRDIVDVSKIEAGKLNIEKSSCRVNKILKELKITFEKEKARQSKSKIQIVLKEAVDDEDFTIFTDPFRFHQIFVNLIGNALKFTVEGSIEFGYVVVDKSKLQFYVKDTGIGIPVDKKDLIFSRFGQIKDNKIKNPGGTGLGLSITKHLVGRLGGKIWVESEIDKGTIFSFTLPFEQLLDYEPKNNLPKDAREEYNWGKIRILAVEDDKINMILLEDTLKLNIENVEIEKAFDGLEAIEKLKNNKFDLIIMDIRMPMLDGYQTTKRIRSEFPFPENTVPILGLSAHALKNEIEEGKKLGMNEFLSKPIQIEELLAKISKLVKNENYSAAIENLYLGDKTDKLENIIDLVFFNKLYKNNTDKINKTLKVYLVQVPEQLDSMERAFQSHKAELLNNISHSLKSTFKYLGRADLSEFSRDIEFSAIDDFDEKLISDRLSKIRSNWMVIEKLIRERLTDLAAD